MEWILWAQIIMQPVLKSGMDNLLSIFFILQMMKGVPLYGFYIPATLEVYLEEVRALIDFEVLKPDGIVGMIWKNETMATLIMK